MCKVRINFIYEESVKRRSLYFDSFCNLTCLERKGTWKLKDLLKREVKDVIKEPIYCKRCQNRGRRREKKTITQVTCVQIVHRRQLKRE